MMSRLGRPLPCAPREISPPSTLPSPLLASAQDLESASAEHQGGLEEVVIEVDPEPPVGETFLASVVPEINAVMSDDNVTEGEMPRTTAQGCACKKSWELAGTGKCDSYCCAPDHDPVGDWCVVEDPDCQSHMLWGYCKKVGEPEGPNLTAAHAGRGCDVLQ